MTRAIRPRLTRDAMVGLVVQALLPSAHNDLPMIRTAINDTADAYRRSGFVVPDFSQTSLVRTIATHLRIRL